MPQPTTPPPTKNSPPPTAQPPVVQAADPDALAADWHVIVNAHHNVRAICDLVGLTYDQKQILTACVYQESQFMNWYPDGSPVIHQNFTFEPNGTKVLDSTDYGIVQINDYYHIGPGKDFLSVEDVVNNPEACVRWMCQYYLQHGNLNAWVSFTSGAYKQWLNKV